MCVKVYDEADLHEFELREEITDLMDANTKLSEDMEIAQMDWAETEQRYRCSQAEVTVSS